MYKKLMISSVIALSSAISVIQANQDVSQYNTFFSLQDIEEKYNNNPFAVYYRADNAMNAGELHEAFELFKRAAELGVSEAIHNVGYMYYNGIGTEINLSEAVKYLNISGNQGILDAQMLMGYLYTQEEKGPRRSLSDAYKWYYLAAMQRNEEARYYVANMMFYGEGTEMNTRMGLALLKEVANNTQNRKINYEIGEIYKHAKNVRRNQTLAKEYYEKAAILGHTEAKYELADIYYYGLEERANKEKALHWFTKAAEDGNVKAMHMLGTMYVNAEGTNKNINKGIEWLEKSAKYNNKESAYKLASIYFKDQHGVDVNPQKAVEWYEKAVNLGHKEAMREFAVIHRRGLGRVLPSDNQEYNRLMNKYYEETPKDEKEKFNMFSFYDGQTMEEKREREFYKDDFEQYFN